jgi:hypothetical protein
MKAKAVEREAERTVADIPGCVATLWFPAVDASRLNGALRLRSDEPLSASDAAHVLAQLAKCHNQIVLLQSIGKAHEPTSWDRIVARHVYPSTGDYPLASQERRHKRLEESLELYWDALLGGSEAADFQRPWGTSGYGEDSSIETGLRLRLVQANYDSPGFLRLFGSPDASGILKTALEHRREMMVLTKGGVAAEADRRRAEADLKKAEAETQHAEARIRAAEASIREAEAREVISHRALQEERLKLAALLISQIGQAAGDRAVAEQLVLMFQMTEITLGVLVSAIDEAGVTQIETESDAVVDAD